MLNFSTSATASVRQCHLEAHTVMVTESGADMLRISGESGLAAMLNGL